MRILVIGKRRYTNKDALTERYGRVYQLPRHWHATGHQVALALLDYRGNTEEQASLDGFPAISLPVLQALGRLRRMADELDPEVIVASGDCFVGLVGWRLSNRRGARFVFDVYDDYRTFGAYRAFFGWDAFGFLVARASMTWYASHALAGKQTSSRAVVPNGVDLDVFHPLAREDAIALTGLDPSAKWIGYFGSMETERGPADLIAAAGLLHEKDPQVRLVLCGGGNRRRFRESWVEDRGNVAHEMVPAFVNACDVVALPYRRGAAIDMASSCKMAEYLFCDRPIVATDTPSLRANFPREADELAQAVARPGDVIDLARALDYQLRQAKVLDRPTGFTWPEIADAALSTLTQLV